MVPRVYPQCLCCLVGYVPVDFTQVPKKVLDYEQALSAVRRTDHLCMLLYNQHSYIPNRSYMTMALITHTFGHVVPMPKSEKASDRDQCFWRQQDMRFERQLDWMLMLSRLMQHFMHCVSALPYTKPTTVRMRDFLQQ